MSFGMLSLKAKVLWPMIISGCDDQGRFKAHPQAMKWQICQNVDEIAKEDIPPLLEEMIAQRMLILYGNDNEYGQILNWWDRQPMAYARPSRYPPPEGWMDRVRYRKGSAEWIKLNWDSPGGFVEGIPKRYVNVSGNHSDKVNEGKVHEGNPPPTEGTRKRDSRLDHPAIIGYKEIARLHVPIPWRDDWIQCANERGVDYLLESLKLWIGNGWNKQNVNGIMDWSRKGRPDGPYRRNPSKKKRREAGGGLDDDDREYFRQLEAR